MLELVPQPNACISAFGDQFHATGFDACARDPKETYHGYIDAARLIQIDSQNKKDGGKERVSATRRTVLRTLPKSLKLFGLR